ncbi:MAG: outer membrane lipoprotein-sorting protein [Massilibacteroides sp.]|nr:outer membrane lipoprotein-sorting protein [Massilibacteroides sp.]MDD3061603.1 outer membrane lipoprotein-sorting protein [Massilibacteroides sp.]MDD4114126.1 outer membrane lipoprotein-sorting protein [Massilibacteroides sp.]MDD4659109.1 outer membrane lipoprotein-sorting protein [Massilibacteroides sp.]
MKNLVLIVALFFASSELNAQSLSGRDIAVKVDNRPDGDTRYSEMTLTLINKNGSKRERQLKSYAQDFGTNMKDHKKIMFFLYPGDVKGTGFLTWEYDQIGKDDDKWLYLPAMKKTRRISGSSSKTDYFMGTDFTYDDMGDRNVDEDSHNLLREENFNGHKCWVLESIPKTSGEIYSKKIAWIRQDCLIAEKIEYYDKLNKLHRLLTNSDIRKIDDIWTINHMLMKNVQSGHQTVIILKNYKYNEKIDKAIFTVTRLEKGL